MDFSRQLKSLSIQCNEIIKEDGVISNGLFYHKLKEFSKFYEEIKSQLIAQTEHEHPLVMEKINSLPTIAFKNYDNPFSAKEIIYTIGYTVFFPIGIIYLLRKYAYVRKTKETLREIGSSLSSIEFLTRNK